MSKNTPSLLLFPVLLFLQGCTSLLTQIEAPLDTNPLPVIAEKAADDYDVEWVDDKTLRLSQSLTGRSIAMLGPSKYRANLHYKGRVLYGQFFIQDNSLWSLYLPNYSSQGAKQTNQILSWAGVDPENTTRKQVWVDYFTPQDVRELPKYDYYYSEPPPP